MAELRAFATFLASVVFSWITVMSGAAALVLTVLGLWFLQPAQHPAAFVAIGALVLIGSTYGAWRGQYQRNGQLQQRLAPRLDIEVAAPHQYTLEAPVTGTPLFGPRTTRAVYFRVRVINRGQEPIAAARLVLESSSLQGESGVHPEHEFARTGGGQGELTFQLMSFGEVLVDVLCEHHLVGTKFALSVCYAAQGRPNEIPSGPNATHTFVIRAEGAGPPCRKTLRFRTNPVSVLDTI